MERKIVIGGDHAGFDLKEILKSYLQERDWNIHDVGTHSSDSVDYPDFAHKLAELVDNEEYNIGILICGSANGVNITANKYANVRSAIAWQPEIAELAKQHNNANVLALPARFISESEAKSILDSFLNSEFEGGRHQRRVNKIKISC